MNTQTKSTMNHPVSSVQAMPFPIVPNLDAQFGIATAVASEGRSQFKLWMNRIGIAGFIFFLVKGLIWLAVFTFGVEAIRNLFC